MRRAALTAVASAAWLASLLLLRHQGIGIYYSIAALASGLLSGALLGVLHPHWLSTPLLTVTVPTAVVLLGPLQALVAITPLLSSSVAHIAARIERPKPRYAVLSLLASLALTLIAGVNPASPLPLLTLPLLLASSYYATLLLPHEWRAAATAYAILAVISAAPGNPFLAAALTPAAIGAGLAFARDLRLKPRQVILRPPRGQLPFIRAELVEATLFTLDVFAGAVLTSTAVDPLSAAAGYAVLIYGLTGLSTSLYRLVAVAPTLKIRPHYSRWYVALFARHPRLWALLEGYTERVKPMLLKAAVFEDPTIYSAKRLALALLALLALPAATPLTLFSPTLAAITGFAVIAASALAAASPWLELPSKASERKRRVEDELPWFVLLAASLQAAGVSLF